MQEERSDTPPRGRRRPGPARVLPAFGPVVGVWGAARAAGERRPAASVCTEIC